VDAEGAFHLRPFVYGYKRTVDPNTFRSTFTDVTEEMYPVQFFAKAEPYKLLGVFPTEVHLFKVEAPGKIFLLGTDSQGRDLFSRILFGARVSLTVGLLGVVISLVLGCFLGMLSGFYGGLTDVIMQRIVEVLLAFPQIPLWLALAAAVPPNWSSIKVYFGVTLVLSIVSWAGLSRQVRAMVLATREQDFVMAARLSGTSDLRIVMHHIFPNILSHVLVVATLSVPCRGRVTYASSCTISFPTSSATCW
jgi:peptide/nickel transport system permease protein